MPVSYFLCNILKGENTYKRCLVRAVIQSPQFNIYKNRSWYTSMGTLVNSFDRVLRVCPFKNFKKRTVACLKMNSIIWKIHSSKLFSRKKYLENSRHIHIIKGSLTKLLFSCIKTGKKKEFFPNLNTFSKWHCTIRMANSKYMYMHSPENVFLFRAVVHACTNTWTWTLLLCPFFLKT